MTAVVSDFCCNDSQDRRHANLKRYESYAMALSARKEIHALRRPKAPSFWTILGDQIQSRGGGFGWGL